MSAAAAGELPAVRTLSSSSGSDAAEDSLAPVKRKAQTGRKRKVAAALADADEETPLRNLLGRKCPCKRSDCFAPLRDSPKFAELLQLRRDWGQLHKLDKDRMVSSLDEPEPFYVSIGEFHMFHFSHFFRVLVVMVVGVLR